MKKKSKYLVLTVIALAVFAVITFGVTYSFFNYMREGSTENTISSGSISFIYEEVNKMGNGIKIEDALPVSDVDGKKSSYFEFKVKSSSAPTIAIPYEITTRVTEGSDVISNYVKVYLTKVNGVNEEQKVLSIYSSLPNSTNPLAKEHNDKTLYTSEIPVRSSNYIETYRLRMWLNNDTNDGLVLDYSPVYACSDTNYTTQETCESNNGVWNPTEEYNNQGKVFSIKVNVYAEGENATQEKIATANSTALNSVSIGNTALTENTNVSANYDYSTSVPNSTETISFDIEPTSPGATVSVVSITASEVTALRTSTTQSFPLVEGDNYFKVTVTSANRQNSEVYVIDVYRESTSFILKDKILSDNASTKDVIIPDEELINKSYTESSDGYQSGLFKALDTNGGYTYYYRGAVTNNYLKIGDDLWRIVRINEDGTIRIISGSSLDYNSKSRFKFNKNTSGSINNMYYTNGTTEGTDYDIHTIVNRWYHDNIENNDNYKNIVTTGTYCQAYKVRYNDSVSPVTTLATKYAPSYNCPEDDGTGVEITKKITLSVGLLNIDELLFAGGKFSNNVESYLYDTTNPYWWTMSPAGYNSDQIYAWPNYTNFNSIGSTITSSRGLRPVINLKSTTMAYKETIDGITYYVVSQ